MEITKLVYLETISNESTMIVIGIIENLSSENYEIVIREKVKERLLLAINNYIVSVHSQTISNDDIYDESEINKILARYYSGYIDANFLRETISIPDFVEKIMNSEMMNDFLERLFSKIFLSIQSSERSINNKETEKEKDFAELKEDFNQEYADDKIEILSIIEALSSNNLDI